MRFEKIWVKQCRATRGIRRRFGAKSALDYLIGEKLATFAQVADCRPECTCAIGRVVDSDLRVYGTEGLLVADASVMPSIVRGNTNAAVIAIAEKAADIVLGNEPAKVP